MLDTGFAVLSLLKLLLLAFTFIVCAISFVLFEFLSKILILFKFIRMSYNIFTFFILQFLFELLYNKYITCFVLRLERQTTKILNKDSIELLGPYNLEKILPKLNNNLGSLNAGIIISYALYILIDLIY